MNKILPTELLFKIVNCLTIDEMLNCLLTCKDWYDIVKYSLYYSINIKNFNQLILLIYCLKLSPKNGHYTKRIYINYIPQDINEQLDTLSNLTPNLGILDFKNSNITKLNWKKLKKISTLNNISCITKYCENLIEVSIQSELLINNIQLLKSIPNVKILTIHDSSTSVNLTMYDIELIQMLLPCLEVLKIKGNQHIQLSITADDIKKIHKLPINQRLKSLCFDTTMTSNLWIHYISHKYPLLTNLELIMHTQQQQQQQHQQQQSYILNLIKDLKYLESISLSCNSINDWLNPTFFESIRNGMIINPIVKRNNQIRFDSDFQLLLYYGKNSMSTLEINQSKLNISLNYTIHLLRNFSILTHLQLKSKEEYHIDSILYNCPLLEYLELEYGTLSYSNDNNFIKHHLKTLTLSNISFKSAIFTYLSEYCGSLTNLYINDCKQIYEMNHLDSQTKIYIHMPNNQFNNVSINGLKLDYSNASLFFNNRVGCHIKLLCIETLYHKNWYYRQEKLYKTDSTRIDSYFTMQQQYTDDHWQFLRNLSQLKLKNNLKTDLMFGYIHIFCHSIDNFSLVA